MIFGRIAVDEAEGAILAHAVNSAPDRLLKKGHVLTRSDIKDLKNNNIQTVLAAKLENTDMGEDQAAATIAAAFTGPHITANPAFTGRANLISLAHGVAVADEALLKKINHVDEKITVATVKNFEVVEAEQMLATIKIIPFAADKTKVADVVRLATQASSPLLSVHPFRSHKIGIISTILPRTKKTVVAKSEKVMETRLRECGNRINARETVEHHEEPLSQSISRLKDQECELILIFGASAITDRNDVIPTAIALTGGKIDHFGMPVDPGNLLLLAHIGETTVIGLPGCTRSPKLNGFDWVLQRLLADIPVTASDIMDMGAGGLLKEITSRPQPRNRPLPQKKDKGQKSVAILMLAAGQSRRMGSQNKLLAEINGKPMLRHTAEQALKSKAAGVFAVTGHEKEKILPLLEEMGIPAFDNPDYAEGLSSSLKTGFRALAGKFDGILICLGDMPLVTAALFNALIEAFDREEGRAIVVPTCQGKRGNPVLIASSFEADILAITGDIGAKSLIADNELVVFNVEVGDNSIFADIDTPDALSNLQRQ
ncbi:MAG: molybdopterin-binding/glycosyltransferase family 2 protein [Sneathiella sp.]|nr:molybdopterin-binding/glycosyltransferase family 2 protein [Sneathiella sp.]